MGFFDFIISIVLLIAGSALTVYLIRPILAQFFPWFRSGKGKIRVSKSKKQLNRVDELLQNQKPLEALRELRKSVVLEISPKSSQQVIRDLKEHHQNVLSRSLIVGEEIGSRANNIAQVEKLFIERSELYVLRHKTSSTFSRVASKREQEGKDVPSWSKTDFKQREKEISKELKRNKKELQEELDKFFTSLERKEESEVVYH